MLIFVFIGGLILHDEETKLGHRSWKILAVEIIDGLANQGKEITAISTIFQHVDTSRKDWIKLVEWLKNNLEKGAKNLELDKIVDFV